MPPGQETATATATARRQAEKARPPPGRAGSDLGPSRVDLEQDQEAATLVLFFLGGESARAPAA